MAHKTNLIARKGLCLGCGLCESVCGKENVRMKLNSDGFFIPSILNKNREGEKIIMKICPSVNIKNDISFKNDERIWGKLLGINSASATNKSVQQKGSSGGIISALAIYLLEEQIVDCVLQVGGDAKDFTSNVLKISRSKEDVLACAASRYAPALVFAEIFEILNNSNDTYCFIGKPCDISAIKNLLNEYPQYKPRFKYYIAIVCAGIPSFNGTTEVINSFDGVSKPVSGLVYRGNGWPGFFTFMDSSNKIYQMSYNDSWGKILGKHVHFRCKICPDGIGLQADFAIGDAWETKDGYPDFTERDGQSLVLIRSKRAMDLYRTICDIGIVKSSDIPITSLQYMQPFQYRRRQYAGSRIAAATIGKGQLFFFKGMKLFCNSIRASKSRAFREFGGTLKRIILR